MMCLGIVAADNKQIAIVTVRNPSLGPGLLMLEMSFIPDGVGKIKMCSMG